MWYHILYACYNNNSLWHYTPLCITSHTVYLWYHIQYIWYHTYCFHDNRASTPDISPTIVDTTATVSVSSHTSVSMHHCINDITTSMEVFALGTRMTSYTLYMTSHSHFMTSMISFYGITTAAFMTEDLLYMTSHPRFMTSHHLYLWHHILYICNITPTMVMNSYTLYLTSNTPC